MTRPESTELANGAVRWVRCGRLIDGTGSVQDGMIVEIVGHVIRRVLREGTDAAAPPHGALVHDLRARTVLPGLIDAHVHLWGSRDPSPTEALIVSHERRLIRAAMDAELLLRSGVTTVRSVGDAFSIALRDAVAEGEIPGPRILSSGRAISQTGGHGDQHFLPLDWARENFWSVVADGVPECLRAVRAQLRDGADAIKVCATGGASSMRDRPEHRQYTLAELSAIVDEAHAWERRVAAHAVSPAGIRNAVMAGVDTIEHGHHLDEPTIELMLDRGTYLVPTLMAGHRNVTFGAKLGAAPWRVAKSTLHHQAHLDSLALAYRMGVPIACGSDNLGPELRPHGTTYEELVLLVETGVTSMDAIKAATSVAAAALGIGHEVGTVAPGMVADLIAVEGDVLEDVGALARVDFVMQRGEVVAPRQSGA